MSFKISSHLWPPSTSGTPPSESSRGVPSKIAWTSTRLLAAESWKFQNQSTKYSKISNCQNTPKYQNTTKFSKFPKFGAKAFYDFWGFQQFSINFSERSRKMLKYGEIPVKIGFDTAIILIFWASFAFWYFGDILIFCHTANSKSKYNYFDKEFCTQEAYQHWCSPVKSLKRYMCT